MLRILYLTNIWTNNENNDKSTRLVRLFYSQRHYFVVYQLVLQPELNVVHNKLVAVRH